MIFTLENISAMWRLIMPKQSKGQKKTVERVMHEYKHGELKSGKRGAAGKVKSRKQAIAIAMSEAGTSKNKSVKTNKRSRANTKAKEHSGQTAKQRKKG
jgi:hypothetical protein